MIDFKYLYLKMNGVHKMLDKIRKLFNKTEEPKKPTAKRKTEKELATERGEPWVTVISVELDPEDVGNGAFELDWNDKFVARLVRAGYKGKTDQQIVDQWFQDVCRNVVMENFEQYEANLPRTDIRNINRNDLGNGRSEIG